MIIIKCNLKILESLRTLMITKRLNVLIGSGASYPAIKLMKDCKGENSEEKNEDLMKSVKESMESLMNGNLEENIKSIADTYTNFFKEILALMDKANSRITPKSVNVFTTNYDLFIENAIDRLLQTNNFIFNDGTSGYFHKYLDGSNFNKTTSYRGLNDNYTDELTVINLFKPHGSINWAKKDENIEVCNTIQQDFVKVPPTGVEAEETFMNNHFHEMLRIFQLELDKQQSILLVVGFSFQDKHIAKMVKRALKNNELLVMIFTYSEDDISVIKGNLDLKNIPSNLYLISPNNFIEDDKHLKNFTFADLTKFINSEANYETE